jgi:hypothetical protein
MDEKFVYIATLAMPGYFWKGAFLSAPTVRKIYDALVRVANGDVSQAFLDVLGEVPLKEAIKPLSSFNISKKFGSGVEININRVHYFGYAI